MPNRSTGSWSGARSPGSKAIPEYLLPLILSVAGAWFGFANPLVHVPPLALLFPAGLAVAGLRAERPGEAFRRGWLAASAAYAAGLYWLALPVHDYGHLSWLLAGPCPMVVGLYLGLYGGLFSLGVRAVRHKLPWLLAGLWAGGLWALLEAARGVLFTGFPWLVLASAFSPWPFAIQGAALLGATGLSGFLAGAAVLVAAGPGKRARGAGALALVLLGLWGLWTVDRPVDAVGTARVVVAQGDIDQSLKWEESYRLGTINRYAALTVNGLRDAPADLVVWPETALPFYFQEPSTFSVAVRKVVREAATPVLTGTPAYTFDAVNQDFLLHNRAVLLDAEARVVGRYDKEHLVPFGEYVPLGEYLPFIKKLAEGAGDFVPGTAQDALDTGAMRLGVMICYETIFPELAQDRVSDGANLLVNISNDAWFGRSSAPAQHLYMSVLRAVEQRRSLVRATNTGISAFIDPRGRILKTGGLFVAGTYRSEAVALVPGKTFFHDNRLGLGAGLAVLLGVCAALAMLEKTRGSRRAPRLANGPGSGYTS